MVKLAQLYQELLAEQEKEEAELAARVGREVEAIKWHLKEFGLTEQDGWNVRVTGRVIAITHPEFHTGVELGLGWTRDGGSPIINSQLLAYTTMRDADTQQLNYVQVSLESATALLRLFLQDNPSVAERLAANA